MKPQVALGKPLTASQLAAVHKVGDEWMRLGLSTQQCDRPRAEAAVRAAYTAAGLPEPALIIWMDSPLGGVFAAAVLKDFLADPADQLHGQLHGQLYGQLHGQLYGQLHGQLRGQLGGQLHGQLGGQLHGQLGGQLRGQLRGQLGREISLWWDCYWIAYLICALPLAGLENSPHLDALAEACRQLGWWSPMRGAAILTDRPTVLRRDDQTRLHSNTGPALAYADGYTLHAWHGITVPSWVIEQPDAERALKERNSEVRRAALEVFGLDRMVKHLGLEPIHTCRDIANGDNELQLYKLPDDFYDTPVNLLVMTNASPDLDGRIRRYGETVPAAITRADEAAAWQFDMSPAIYRQMERST